MKRRQLVTIFKRYEAVTRELIISETLDTPVDQRDQLIQLRDSLAIELGEAISHLNTSYMHTVDAAISQSRELSLGRANEAYSQFIQFSLHLRKGKRA